MKKMLLATAFALRVQDISNRRYCSKNRPAADGARLITMHFFVSGIRPEKPSDAINCGSAEMLLKPKPANIRKMDAPVLLL